MAARNKVIQISRRKNGAYSAKFKEQLAVNNIHAINEKINVIFDDAKSLKLDLSEIQTIDLAGIQLIKHIIDRCKNLKIKPSIQKPFTSEIVQLLEKTGLETVIELKQ